MAELWTGRSLGGYLITEKIGSGGMGEVYRAVQTSVDRSVAIKILLPILADDPVLVARFRQEARMIATLEHPHILPLIDFGDEAGVLYLVTRYLNGGTLHDLIRASPLPPPAALRYLTDIGEALDYAHSQGVVHRDIKPSNVLLDGQDNSFIADFGLAKTLNTAGLTQGGLGLGTPLYMSPEQGRTRPVDHRTDIYSLGIVAYEMITGRVPFDAENMMGIIMKHISDPVPSVTLLNPELPRAFDVVFARALAKKPPDRYATVREFVKDFARAIEDPRAFESTLPLIGPPVGKSAAPPPDDVTRILAAPSVPPAPAAEKEPARQRWLGFGLGGAALGLAVLAWVWFASASPGAPPATPTLTAAPVTAAATVTAEATKQPTVTSLTSSPQPSPTVAGLSLAPKDAMELVYIPAGNFLFGSADSDPAAQPDEKPQQELFLDDFWMDRTEVTVAQFQDFVNATRYQTDAELGCCAGGYARTGGIVTILDPEFVRSAAWKLPQGAGAPPALPRRPVVQVSWNDAKAYCTWAGRRLPTQAEWEKAARGVSGRIYPWGDAFDGTRLNFCDRSCGQKKHDADYDDTFARASNVGSFPGGASPYGLLDMSGNAREWVSDVYVPGDNAAPAVQADSLRVIRGGAWIDAPARVRAAARAFNRPDARDDTTGFRCAVSATDLPLP